MGYVRTGVLMAAMTALFLVVGGLIAGQTGALIALVVAGAMNLFTFWNSDRAVLSMHGAVRSTHARRPISTAWSAGWSTGRRCRCRGSICSKPTSPTPLPPAAIRRTRGSR